MTSSSVMSTLCVGEPLQPGALPFQAEASKAAGESGREVEPDGVLRHEDDVVEHDFLVALLVVEDDGGEQKVEDSEAHKQDHQAEQSVGEYDSDSAAVIKVSFRILERSFEVELSEAERHHEDGDSTHEVVSEHTSPGLSGP